MSAGRPRERSHDSMTVKRDLSRDRLQSVSADIQDPEMEGRKNRGGRMYSSIDLTLKRRLNTASNFQISDADPSRRKVRAEALFRIYDH